MNLKTLIAALTAAVFAVGMAGCNRDNAGAGSSANQTSKSRPGGAASGSSSMGSSGTSSPSSGSAASGGSSSGSSGGSTSGSSSGSSK